MVGSLVAAALARHASSDEGTLAPDAFALSSLRASATSSPAESVGLT